MKFLKQSQALTTILCLGLSLIFAQEVQAENGEFINLANGWQIQAANEVLVGDNLPGTTVSSDGYSTSGWHAATVPTTVLAALVNDGVYTNIYFGTNLTSIPQTPFAGAWLFRNVFTLSTKQAAQNADLIFDGINYRANIWLNGKQLADTNTVFGAFKTFNINASGNLKPGNNVLVVEVFPPQSGDFTMGFVDWNPQPPDREMGLFRPVRLHLYHDVVIENVFVKSKIDHQGWQNAALTIQADLKNSSGHELNTQIAGTIGEIHFAENFTLQPGETRTVELTPEHNAPLNIKHAQLWWPWELGEPHLYQLDLTASVNGTASDSAQTRFGVREVADYLTPDGYRGYMINGKKILLRGGGWADELLLRENSTNLTAQVQYTKAMNLNTIRLEGFWGSSQQLYDLADEYGLFIMAGFSCQWEWKDYIGKNCDNFGGIKSEADMTLANNYLHDQVVWLRNHPALLVWVLGSDKLPRPELETRYDALMKLIDPTRPTLKTCGDDASKISGPSAVKMNGPYDYVTPNYWYEDIKNGGAFGFNTETGPGPQPPPLETLQRMIPADHLWPIDDVWNFHCGRHEFAQMKRYLAAYNSRYGAAANVDEFAFKSQAANYEAIRPMYEAFAVNLPHTTGIIQWMLNPSWPKLYWQLYDYYLVPGGAFFGAKKGAAPFSVIYNYGNKGIYLVNQTGNDLGKVASTITVYDLNSKVLLTQTVTSSTANYGSQKILDLAGLTSPTPVYFVNLQTVGNSGETSASNFYWLSTKPDVLDEGKTQWFVTPNKSFGDFSALNQLPPAKIKYAVSYNKTGAQITLENNGDTLAFFVELKIIGAQSKQILTPVFWDDNYLSLPPHTTRVLQVQFPADEKPELKLRGWNVQFESK